MDMFLQKRLRTGQRQQGWQSSVRLSYLEVNGSQVLESVLPPLAILGLMDTDGK